MEDTKWLKNATALLLGFVLFILLVYWQYDTICAIWSSICKPFVKLGQELIVPHK
ncbi:MAG: hypothetical protein UW45_C0067G0007 [Parcubacteria group bacterium GW2011_GWC2_44_22]|nr:MAG: hypothetical protein UW45_C0067G0007 [Parcubacteria group bacterium GW2011_GWC2_44_22]